jgi:hypothetical protein
MGSGQGRQSAAAKGPRFAETLLDLPRGRRYTVATLRGAYALPLRV